MPERTATELPVTPRLGSPRILARRFVATLVSQPPSAEEKAWVASILLNSEWNLWTELSNNDKRHALEVAQSVQRKLAGTTYESDSVWLAAALLHDAGKAQSGLGWAGRVFANAIALVFPLPGRFVTSLGGFGRRAEIYLMHGPIGAELIRLGGGRESVAMWAEVHQNHDLWGKMPIPSIVLKALASADAESPALFAPAPKG